MARSCWWITLLSVTFATPKYQPPTSHKPLASYILQYRWSQVRRMHHAILEKKCYVTAQYNSTQWLYSYLARKNCLKTSHTNQNCSWQETFSSIKRNFTNKKHLLTDVLNRPPVYHKPKASEAKYNVFKYMYRIRVNFYVVKIMELRRVTTTKI